MSDFFINFFSTEKINFRAVKHPQAGTSRKVPQKLHHSKKTIQKTRKNEIFRETKLSMSADLSSFIANNSMNPFDSLLLNSLHKSINFSPRVVFSVRLSRFLYMNRIFQQEACSSSQKADGEKFQWSVEQLAILKPAHISEDEIAASYQSP